VPRRLSALKAVPRLGRSSWGRVASALARRSLGCVSREYAAIPPIPRVKKPRRVWIVVMVVTDIRRSIVRAVSTSLLGGVERDRSIARALVRISDPGQLFAGQRSNKCSGNLQPRFQPGRCRDGRRIHEQPALHAATRDVHFTDVFLFQVVGPVRRPAPDDETVVPDDDTPVAVEHPSHAAEHFFRRKPSPILRGGLDAGDERGVAVNAKRYPTWVRTTRPSRSSSARSSPSPARETL